ncbi:WhiB family transcriptional regulator [Streptomyces radiopugnans]|nr:WhiB family transcriptional regulator [Streptomyces radiopugnans]
MAHRDYRWQDYARCREVDPDLWFEQARKAKRICAGCEAREACLADALASHDEYGVRGGLTYHERLRHARQQNEQHAA